MLLKIAVLFSIDCPPLSDPRSPVFMNTEYSDKELIELFVDLLVPNTGRTLLKCLVCNKSSKYFRKDKMGKIRDHLRSCTRKRRAAASLIAAERRTAVVQEPTQDLEPFQDQDQEQDQEQEQEQDDFHDHEPFQNEEPIQEPTQEPTRFSAILSSNQEREVISITPEIRFMCSFAGCDYTAKQKSDVVRHEKETKKHKLTGATDTKYLHTEVGKDLFFVRLNTRGPDHKVHVDLNEKRCSSKKCRQLQTNPSIMYICNHLRCVMSRKFNDMAKCVLELDDSSLGAKKLSRSTEAEIVELIDNAQAINQNLIVESSETPKNLRHFSVLALDSSRKYVRFMNGKGWTCDGCPRYSNPNRRRKYCAHVIACQLAVLKFPVNGADNLVNINEKRLEYTE